MCMKSIKLITLVVLLGLLIGNNTAFAELVAHWSFDGPAATQITGWNEWVIDLQEFVGVNLTDVNTITIGLGTKNPGAPGPGGTGTMYFDDIRLYR